MWSKLAAIHAELSAWNERQTASREELQSIIGVLSFAAKVVAPGRTFLRRMIDHLKSLPPYSTQTSQHPLSDSFRMDVAWWRKFLTKWNGQCRWQNFDVSNLHHLCIRAAMWLGTCGLPRAGEFTKGRQKTLTSIAPSHVPCPATTCLTLCA